MNEPETITPDTQSVTITEDLKIGDTIFIRKPMRFRDGKAFQCTPLEEFEAYTVKDEAYAPGRIECSFERTHDAELVKRIVTHPKIWPNVSDDFSPAPGDYIPPMDEAIWHLVALLEEELNAAETGVAITRRKTMGIFSFIPRNAVEAEVHTCILPAFWGDPALQAGRGVIQWIWENTTFQRIVTNCPAYNRSAIKFAEACGLRLYGIDSKSYRKHGVLHDQFMFGISKEMVHG